MLSEQVDQLGAELGRKHHHALLREHILVRNHVLVREHLLSRPQASMNILANGSQKTSHFYPTPEGVIDR